MKRITILMALLLLSGVLAPLAPATATPMAMVEVSLQGRLLTATPGERIPALILLRERVDWSDLYPQLIALGRRARHELAVRTLQQTAGRTQGPLLRYLDRQSRLGNVDRVKPFWVANVIAVEATPAVLLEIAQRADVLYLQEDHTYPLDTVAGAPAQTAPPEAIEPGLVVVGADQMWARGWTGEDVLVATIDTGAWLDHPTLQPRWRGNEPGVSPAEAWYDYFGTTTTPSDTERCGSHGTHVMGTLVGDDGAQNQIGVAPGAQWIAARIFGPPGTACSSSDSTKLAGWQWVLDPDGNPNTVDDFPHVVNRSGGERGPGGGGLCRPLPDPVWDAISAVVAAGATVFFGAGNEGPAPESIISWASQVHSPILAFSVGNVNGSTLIISSSSSRGPSPCDHASIKPEVVAPGVSIRSAVLDGYGYKSGTSMSTPHVSGAAAILWQAFPHAGGETLQDALLNAARDLGPAGEDNDYGMGLVYLPDAYRRIFDLTPSAITVTPGIALPEKRLTYTVSLLSQGQVSATADLQDTLPGEVTLDPDSLWASAGQWGHSGGVITWTGTLYPAQPVTLTFAVTLSAAVTDGQQVENVALLDDGLGPLPLTATVRVDTAPPSSAAAAPPYAQTSFTVTFAASDTVSGVALTRLWTRYEQEPWSDSGLSLPGDSGAFPFTPTQGQGRYDFATQAVDWLGWQEAEPQGVGDDSTLVDTTLPSSTAASPPYARAPFTVTFVASDTVSGVALTRLWTRYEQEPWIDTGQSQPGENGFFPYTPTLGDGQYHFASQAFDHAGWPEQEPQGDGDSTTLWDTTAPSSTAFSPWQSLVPTFTVSWTGEDGPTGSGVVAFQLHMRTEQPGATWTVWISETAAFSGTYVGVPGQRFCFRSSARDLAGNVEPVPGDPWGDSCTQVNAGWQIFLPLVMRGGSG